VHLLPGVQAHARGADRIFQRSLFDHYCYPVRLSCQQSLAGGLILSADPVPEDPGLVPRY
ncbi:MAG: hypothetical protein WBN31_12865, partial [Gammaproteobacteria bacterium]